MFKEGNENGHSPCSDKRVTNAERIEELDRIDTLPVVIVDEKRNLQVQISAPQKSLPGSEVLRLSENTRSTNEKLCNKLSA